MLDWTLVTLSGGQIVNVMTSQTRPLFSLTKIQKKQSTECTAAKMIRLISVIRFVFVKRSLSIHQRPTSTHKYQRTKNADCLGNTAEGERHSEKQEMQAGIASQVQPYPWYRQLSQMTTNSSMKQVRGNLCT